MIRVSFVTFTDLRTGAGVEKFLINLLIHSPKEGFQITVVQTDYLTKRRVSGAHINKVLNGFRNLRMKVYETKFDFMWKNRFMGAFASIFIRPISMAYLNKRYNRKIIRDVSKSDIIYLFKNEYSKYFKKSRAILVGSNHCDFHNSKKPETILTTRGLENLVYKGISVYHIFPGKHELKEFFGDKRAFVLPPGVDTNIYYPNLTRGSKLKVLFVGRLEKSKGVLEFLQAYNLVREQKKFEFHVVGTGSLSEKVMEHSSSDFIYHGALEEEDLAQVYRSCDVFLFPTQLDSFPVVILEALASGLFVLTTYEMRGTFDDFKRLNYLSYVNPEPMELARVLLELLHNDLIGQLNKKAMFNKVRESYDWSYISAQFFGSLSNLIRS